jgi:hypothetical protein
MRRDGSRQPEWNSKQLLKLNINSTIIIIFHVEDASFGKLANSKRMKNIESNACRTHRILKIFSDNENEGEIKSLMG